MRATEAELCTLRPLQDEYASGWTRKWHDYRRFTGGCGAVEGALDPYALLCCSGSPGGAGARALAITRFSVSGDNKGARRTAGSKLEAIAMGTECRRLA